MRLGVVFPQHEIGNDPGAIHDFAQAAESLGYDHILVFDHVIGANAASRQGWGSRPSHIDSFYEPLVLFGYLAAVTKTIELATGILILPQRQTVLIAKQAAAADVLSGGRLRLGIGIGWNEVEYEALGEDFHNRGLRSEEQIEVLRALWTQELVTYNGRWHRIADAGLNPLPLQRPIPVWFGGTADPVLRRIARLGDGWFTNMSHPDEASRGMIDRLRGYASKEGRDTNSLGIESWVSVKGRSADQWVRDAVKWEELGATHISLHTMGAGLSWPDGHLDTISRFKKAMDSA